MKVLRKILCTVLVFSVLAAIACVPTLAAGNIVSGVAAVTASALNLRAGQGTDTAIVGEIPGNSEVLVLEKTSDEWYKVFYNSKIGFVASEFLSEIKATADLSTKGIVTDDEVNCRSGAGTEYESLGYLEQYTVYTITGIENGWYRIDFGDETGYVRSDFISLPEAASFDNGNDAQGEASAQQDTSDTDQTDDETAADSKTADFVAMDDTGKVIGTDVNVRTAPSTDSDVLGFYTYGEEYHVLGKTGNWYKLRYNDQTDTYIYADYLRLSSEAGYEDVSTASISSVYSNAGQQIADFALQFKGHRYIYGAAGPDAFDCSGLVYYTLTQLGYTDLQRTAGSQYNKMAGTYISKSQLLPGDLVFFSSNGGSSITHVGIYIGNNEFVHASTSTTGVIVSDLTSAYYQTVYYGAKRVWS